MKAELIFQGVNRTQILERVVDRIPNPGFFNLGQVTERLNTPNYMGSRDVTVHPPSTCADWA